MSFSGHTYTSYVTLWRMKLPWFYSVYIFLDSYVLVKRQHNMVRIF